MRGTVKPLFGLLIIALWPGVVPPAFGGTQEPAQVTKEVTATREAMALTYLEGKTISVKFALAFGGSYGRGVMVCRTGEDFTGPWGSPAMCALEGGSFGLQLGGQATDFVFLVMNPRGVDSLLRSKVKLGVDASATAGPKGRSALAGTDAYMRAEILSYSRSRGLFAGVSLDGSTLRPDNAANEKVYRRKVTAREVVRENAVPVPDAGHRLVSLLQNASSRNQSG